MGRSTQEWQRQYESRRSHTDIVGPGACLPGQWRPLGPGKKRPTLHRSAINSKGQNWSFLLFWHWHTPAAPPLPCPHRSAEARRRGAKPTSHVRVQEEQQVSPQSHRASDGLRDRW